MRLTQIFLAMMVMMAAAAPAWAQDLKIAVVSPREVAAKMPQRQMIAEQLKAEFDARNKELESMAKAIREKQANLERDQATMTATQVTEKRREIEQEIANFKLKEKAFQEDYKKRGNEEFMKLQARIQQAIEAIGKRDGYDLVLVRDQIPFSSQKLDITAEVIKMVTNSKGK